MGAWAVLHAGDMGGVYSVLGSVSRLEVLSRYAYSMSCRPEGEWECGSVGVYIVQYMDGSRAQDGARLESTSALCTQVSSRHRLWLLSKALVGLKGVFPVPYNARPRHTLAATRGERIGIREEGIT